MSLFRGLCAFPITPCDPHGRVDPASLRRLLDRLVASGVGSIGLLGSTGSYAYLERAERRRAIDAAIDQVGGRVPVLVGIGALRTDHAVQFGQDARDAGADAVLLAPVSYTPLTDDEVFTHYDTVAPAVGLPLCIYNNPGTTHFPVGTALLARLARVPNIVALKQPAPATELVRPMLDELRRAAGPDLAIGVSGDWTATEALLAGADGWYSVLAGLFPAPCRQIADAVLADDADQARHLHQRLQPLWEMFIAFGSLRVMHAAARLLELCSADPLRPILPLDEAARARLAQVLRTLELH